MKLIVLAHYGEAQIIIDHYSLSKKSEELYQNDDLTLLLTGEGPFEATSAVSSLLATQKFNEVINLGIAGSLDQSAQQGVIYQVRSIYLVVDGKLQYKSFTLSDQGHDLITSFERILQPEKVKPLSGMGQIVDREAWGVAFACKEHGIKLSSYKLISDVAGTIGSCEAIKENAQSYSVLLLEKLKEVLQEESLHSHKKEFNLGSQFYFTFSLKHKFNHLLEMISLRDQVSKEDVLSTLNINELLELNVTPKMRAKALVEKLEILIDPFKGELTLALKDWKKQYSQFDIFTDPSWESDEVKFSFSVKNSQELQERAALLSELDLEKFYDLQNGVIRVE